MKLSLLVQRWRDKDARLLVSVAELSGQPTIYGECADELEAALAQQAQPHIGTAAEYDAWLDRAKPKPYFHQQAQPETLTEPQTYRFPPKDGQKPASAYYGVLKDEPQPTREMIAEERQMLADVIAAFNWMEVGSAHGPTNAHGEQVVRIATRLRDRLALYAPSEAKPTEQFREVRLTPRRCCISFQGELHRRGCWNKPEDETELHHNDKSP